MLTPSQDKPVCSSSSSNFISRRIHKTYAQHYNNNFTKCIPLAVAREAQRLIKLTTVWLNYIWIHIVLVICYITHMKQNSSDILWFTDTTRKVCFSHSMHQYKPICKIKKQIYVILWIWILPSTVFSWYVPEYTVDFHNGDTRPLHVPLRQTRFYILVKLIMMQLDYPFYKCHVSSWT